MVGAGLVRNGGGHWTRRDDRPPLSARVAHDVTALGSEVVHKGRPTDDTPDRSRVHRIAEPSALGGAAA